MADKYISKVVYNGKTLIDLTNDTVIAEKLLKDYTAHGANGESIKGTCDFDANTGSATAQSTDEILAGTKVWVRGSEWTGTMANKGSVSGIMTGWTQDGEGNKVAPHYTIEKGYHDGGGKVTLSQADLSELIASNIRKNHTILGVTGTMEGNENENLQERTVDAPLGGPNNTGEDLVVVCEEKDAEGKLYTGLSKVTVRKVPYVENPNGAGGITVTIGEAQAS